MSFIILLLWVTLDHLLSHIKSSRDRHNELLHILNHIGFYSEQTNRKNAELQRLLEELKYRNH